MAYFFGPAIFDQCIKLLERIELMSPWKIDLPSDVVSCRRYIINRTSQLTVLASRMPWAIRSRIYANWRT